MSNGLVISQRMLSLLLTAYQDAPFMWRRGWCATICSSTRTKRKLHNIKPLYIMLFLLLLYSMLTVDNKSHCRMAYSLHHSIPRIIFYLLLHIKQSSGDVATTLILRYTYSLIHTSGNCRCKREHITAVLFALHWRLIEFKLLRLVYRVVHHVFVATYINVNAGPITEIRLVCLLSRDTTLKDMVSTPSKWLNLHCVNTFCCGTFIFISILLLRKTMVSATDVSYSERCCVEILGWLHIST